MKGQKSNFSLLSGLLALVLLAISTVPAGTGAAAIQLSPRSTVSSRAFHIVARGGVDPNTHEPRPQLAAQTSDDKYDDDYGSNGHPTSSSTPGGKENDADAGKDQSGQETYGASQHKQGPHGPGIAVPIDAGRKLPSEGAIGPGLAGSGHREDLIPASGAFGQNFPNHKPHHGTPQEADYGTSLQGPKPQQNLVGEDYGKDQPDKGAHEHKGPTPAGSAQAGFSNGLQPDHAGETPSNGFGGPRPASGPHGSPNENLPKGEIPTKGNANGDHPKGFSGSNSPKEGHPENSIPKVGIPNGSIESGVAPKGGVPSGGAPNSGAPSSGPPKGVHSEGGIPKGGIPGAGAPKDSHPEGSVPKGGIPSADVPKNGRPEGSVPKGGIPGAIPGGGVPKNGHPEGSNPKGGIPSAGVPKNGRPEESVPNGRIPGAGVPKNGHPEGSVPKGGIPGAGVPKNGHSEGSVPKGGIPSAGVPKNGHPVENVPNGRIPGAGVPKDSHPEGSIPKGGIPKGGVPGGGIASGDIGHGGKEGPKSYGGGGGQPGGPKIGTVGGNNKGPSPHAPVSPPRPNEGIPKSGPGINEQGNQPAPEPGSAGLGGAHPPIGSDGHNQGTLPVSPKPVGGAPSPHGKSDFGDEGVHPSQPLGGSPKGPSLGGNKGLPDSTPKPFQGAQGPAGAYGSGSGSKGSSPFKPPACGTQNAIIGNTPTPAFSCAPSAIFPGAIGALGGQKIVQLSKFGSTLSLIQPLGHASLSSVWSALQQQQLTQATEAVRVSLDYAIFFDVSLIGEDKIKNIAEACIQP